MSVQTPRRSGMWRLLKLFLALILFLIVAGWVIVWHVAPRAILEPQRTGVGASPPDGIKAAVFSVSEDIELAAWKAEPIGPPRGAIIVLHGIADSKAPQAGTLIHLAQSGILGIAPDLRGHGDSPGFASYGFHEKSDLSQILDSLKADHPQIKVGIWGTSYGGAVALQAAAEDPRFSFVIVESTFADLIHIGRQQVGMNSSTLLEWTAPIALSRAGELGRFDPEQVAPEQALLQISAPVLHLHGDNDQIIPFSNALRIQAIAGRPNCRFVPMPGAGHYNLRETDPAHYDLEIAMFLGQVLPARSPTP